MEPAHQQRKEDKPVRSTIITRSLLLLFLLAASWGHAQTEDVNFKVRCIADPAKVAQALKVAADKKQAPDITGAKVCYAGQGAPSPAQETSETEYTFSSEITLAVEHAPEVDFDEITEPNPGDLVLFLDGKPLHGTHPRLGPSALDEDAVTTTLLTYRITHDLTTPAAQASWKAILVGGKSQKVMTVSTGLETGGAASSQATILFTAISPGYAFLFALIAAVVVLVFFAVAIKTDALRDKEPANDEVAKGEKRRAYSLSRCQIAAWTVIVVLAYLFIWTLTGQYLTTIPASIVILMGISLGTYGVAASVDKGAANSNREKLKKLQEHKAEAVSKDRVQASLVDEEISAVARCTKVSSSDGVVEDLLTSSEGTSLHRLQFAVWTLALMVVFLATAWTTLQMPDFDTTLLALIGISSGTYAGLKVPENKS